jgi:amidohydrolase
MLEAAGFLVRDNAAGLDTAFVASVGSGPLHIALCAEYDALPGIGHACGHNMIAAMSIGAGIALRDLADDLGLTVSVMGTPAEEVGDSGGKILMLEAGLFDDVHAAMMIHPGPVDAGNAPWQAASTFDVHFHGKTAHAAAAPELGINALDAMTVAQTAIGLLRQHLDPSGQVHGIVTHGGDAPGVVPHEISGRYMVRAPDLDRMEVVKRRVLACFEAGAIATGAELEITGGSKPYAQVRNDRGLMSIYEEQAASLGRELVPRKAFGETRGAASTDMGNVSLALPAIHPLIGIDSFPHVPHQPEFAAHAISAAADKAVVEGAAALAMTAVAASLDETTRSRLISRG